jgi:hypothetical protein
LIVDSTRDPILWPPNVLQHSAYGADVLGIIRWRGVELNDLSERTRQFVHRLIEHASSQWLSKMLQAATGSLAITPGMRLYVLFVRLSVLMIGVVRTLRNKFSDLFKTTYLSAWPLRDSEEEFCSVFEGATDENQGGLNRA